MNTRLRTRIALLACCCAAPLALAADKLDVKPGLWEITSSHLVSGIPAEKGSQTETERECITSKDVEKPFDVGQKDCTQTVVRTTRTTQEVRLQCNGTMKGSGVLRVTTLTPETMTGTLDLTLGEGKDAMKVKSELKGRWLGPDCGDESDDDSDDDEDEDETG